MARTRVRVTKHPVEVGELGSPISLLPRPDLEIEGKNLLSWLIVLFCSGLFNTGGVHRDGGEVRRGGGDERV